MVEDWKCDGCARYYEDEPIEIGPHKLCSSCTQVCDGEDCEVTICTASYVIGDTYDEGYGLTYQADNYMNPDFYCIDCYEKACNEGQIETARQALRDYVNPDIQLVEGWEDAVTNYGSLWESMDMNSDQTWNDPPEDDIKSSLKAFGLLDPEHDDSVTPDEDVDSLLEFFERDDMKAFLVCLQESDMSEWFRIHELLDRVHKTQEA